MSNWKGHFLGNYNGRRRVSSPRILPRGAAPETQASSRPEPESIQPTVPQDPGPLEPLVSDRDLLGQINYDPVIGLPLVRRRSASPYFWVGLMLTLGVLAVATARVIYLQSQPVVSEKKPKLIAVRVQVRSSYEEARRYLEDKYPALLHRLPVLMDVVDLWNSEKGRRRHGVVAGELPFFIPEPRKNMENDFEDLVGELVSGAIRFHVFGYRSEKFLSRVAADCGLDPDPPESALSWIHKWSRWRKDSGSQYETQCTPGGVCLLLTRGCKADTFD